MRPSELVTRADNSSRIAGKTSMSSAQHERGNGKRRRSFWPRSKSAEVETSAQVHCKARRFQRRRRRQLRCRSCVPFPEERSSGVDEMIGPEAIQALEAGPLHEVDDLDGIEGSLAGIRKPESQTETDPGLQCRFDGRDRARSLTRPQLVDEGCDQKHVDDLRFPDRTVGRSRTNSRSRIFQSGSSFSMGWLSINVRSVSHGAADENSTCNVRIDLGFGD